MVKVNAESALSLPDPEHFAKEGRPSKKNSHNVRVNSQGHGTNAAYLAARLVSSLSDKLEIL